MKITSGRYYESYKDFGFLIQTSDDLYTSILIAVIWGYLRISFRSTQ